MEPAHISELLLPFTGRSYLSVYQLEQLSLYLELLVRWNARTNLTAVRDARSIVLRHFGESVFAAKCLLHQNSQETVIDLGSGAGFPGIPLKIFAPTVALTLIESQNKKATFLKEVIRWLKLERVTVFHGRAEAFAGKGDVVTLRAVEHFEQTLPIAESLVSSSDRGRLGLLIGTAQVETAKKTLKDFEWKGAVPIPLSSERVVLIGTKAAVHSEVKEA